MRDFDTVARSIGRRGLIGGLLALAGGAQIHRAAAGQRLCERCGSGYGHCGGILDCEVMPNGTKRCINNAAAYWCAGAWYQETPDAPPNTGYCPDPAATFVCREDGAFCCVGTDCTPAPGACAGVL